MNRLIRLTKQHTELRANMATMLDARAESDEDFSEAQRATFDEMTAELKTVTERITEENIFRDSELEQKPARTGNDNPADDPLDRDEPHAVDKVRPFRSFGEQLIAVQQSAVSHNLDPRLSEIQGAIQGASEGVPSDGGFMVQTDFAADVLRDTYETAIIWNAADDTSIGAMSNGLKQNAVDETSRANGSRWGGIQAFWDGEGDAATKSKPKFFQFELILKKLRGLFYATDELMQDAQALTSIASQGFAEEFGFILDDVAVNGDGSGKPIGIVGHNATVSVAKEDGQLLKTVLAENIEKMYTRMMAKFLPGATWYINQDVFPQLFQLQHTVGTGGVPVFMPPGGLSVAPFGTLLGRPVVPIEQCATLGTVGDIIFANWKQYKTISKGGMQTARSMHVEFLTGQEVFRFTMRTDGKPKRKSKVTPFKGTLSLSPFVTLATRA